MRAAQPLSTVQRSHSLIVHPGPTVVTPMGRSPDMSEVKVPPGFSSSDSASTAPKEKRRADLSHRQSLNDASSPLPELSPVANTVKSWGGVPISDSYTELVESLKQSRHDVADKTYQETLKSSNERETSSASQPPIIVDIDIAEYITPAARAGGSAKTEAASNAFFNMADSTVDVDLLDDVKTQGQEICNLENANSDSALTKSDRSQPSADSTVDVDLLVGAETQDQENFHSKNSNAVSAISNSLDLSQSTADSTVDVDLLVGAETQSQENTHSKNSNSVSVLSNSLDLSQSTADSTVDVDLLGSAETQDQEKPNFEKSNLASALSNSLDLSQTAANSTVDVDLLVGVKTQDQEDSNSKNSNLVSESLDLSQSAADSAVDVDLPGSVETQDQENSEALSALVESLNLSQTIELNGIDVELVDAWQETFDKKHKGSSVSSIVETPSHEQDTVANSTTEVTENYLGRASRADMRRAQKKRAEAMRQEVARARAVRLEAKREANELQTKRREAGRALALRSEAIRARAVRLEAKKERAETARVAAQRAEAKRALTKRAEAKRAEAKRAEAKRAEGMRADARRAEATSAEAKRVEAVRAEARSAEAKRAESGLVETKRVEAKRAEVKRAEAKRAEAKRAEARRAEARRAEARRAEAKRAEAKLAAEKRAKDRSANTAKANGAEAKSTGAKSVDAKSTEVKRAAVGRVEANIAKVRRSRSGDAERVEKSVVEQAKLVTSAKNEKLNATNVVAEVAPVKQYKEKSTASSNVEMVKQPVNHPSPAKVEGEDVGIVLPPSTGQSLSGHPGWESDSSELDETSSTSFVFDPNDYLNQTMEFMAGIREEDFDDTSGFTVRAASYSTGEKRRTWLARTISAIEKVLKKVTKKPVNWICSRVSRK